MKTKSLRLVAALGLTFSVAVVHGEDFTCQTNNGTITITKYISTGEVVVVPSTLNGLPVTSIGPGAFTCCSSVISITIPNSVTNIGFRAFGSSAFGQCMNLVEINVDPLNSDYSSVNGVLFDKKQATLIQYPERRAGSYAVPQNVSDIGEAAFFFCQWLNNVAIPAGVMNVGPRAFHGCTSLTNVSLPQTIRNIGQGAFSGCGFSSIAIPNGVTKVQLDTFYNCTSLTNVVIPNTVSVIEHGAFENCSGVTGFYFFGSAPSVADSSVFLGDDKATIYYLPGNMGWSGTYAGHATAPWVLPYPVILTTASNFGIQSNNFGFRMSWATNATVVVEASTTLSNPFWSPVNTNTLTQGWADSNDAEWTNSSARFYRVRSL